MALAEASYKIKADRRMKDVKFPLVEKFGAGTLRVYFTKAENTYYTRIMNALMKRKGHKKVECKYLYCFEYVHSKSSWFLKEQEDITDMVMIKFNEYYKNVVEEEFRKFDLERGKK